MIQRSPILPIIWVFVLVIGSSAPTLIAQIAVPSTGVAVTFDNAPPASEWTALSVGSDSGSAVITTAAELDAQIQQLSIAEITDPLPSTSFYPPLQSNSARWNSTARLIQSRPGNNWCAVLAGAFVNSGSIPAQTIGIAFDLGAGAINIESNPGFRVYYSLTGVKDSWRVVEGVSTGVTGRVSAVFSLFPAVWFVGNPLYLLWADDNGPASDGYYTMDNVTVELSPTLRVSKAAGTEIDLSWSDGWNNCYLESSTNLVAQNWQYESDGNDIGITTCTNGVCRRKVRISQQRFFRMHCGVLIP